MYSPIGHSLLSLEAGAAFYIELRLELEGRATVEGASVDRTVGLDGVRSDIAMLRTPDGHGRVGTKQVPLCYVRGPEGIMIALAEELG
jgi:hypothetical protein